MGGWNTLVEKLGDLGVALFVGAKPPITLVAQMKEKRVVFGSFSEDAKSESKRLGDSVWLEAGVREMQGRMEQLKRCLVGWWGNSLASIPELDFLRRWVNL